MIKRLYELKRTDNGKYEILEINSGLIIQTYDDEKVARLQYRKLKRGTGFNGWTPPFFVKTV